MYLVFKISHNMENNASYNIIARARSIIPVSRTVTFVLRECSKTASKDGQDYGTSSKDGVDHGMRREKKTYKDGTERIFRRRPSLGSVKIVSLRC